MGKRMGTGRMDEVSSHGTGGDETMKRPTCFGVLDRVFPLKEDGLRESPETCMACAEKTLCLKAALDGGDGWKTAEERVDRAYVAGHLGFLGRWSKRKALSLHKKKADDAAGGRASSLRKG